MTHKVNIGWPDWYRLWTPVCPWCMEATFAFRIRSTTAPLESFDFFSWHFCWKGFILTDILNISVQKTVIVILQNIYFLSFFTHICHLRCTKWIPHHASHQQGSLKLDNCHNDYAWTNDSYRFIMIENIMSLTNYPYWLSAWFFIIFLCIDRGR